MTLSIRMLIICHILLVTGMFFPTCGISAQEVGGFIGAEPVNTYRYKDINGSPYLFDTFSLGTIYGADLTVYPNQFFNYNGRTELLEVVILGKIHELDPDKYLRAVTSERNAGKLAGNGKIILQRGVHKKFQNGFVRVVYRGRRIILVDQFKAEIGKVTPDEMGKKGRFKAFRRTHKYYLKHHSDLHFVRLDEKSISKILGHEQDLEQFMNDNQLDASREKDMSRILKWYEDKGFVR